MGGKSNDAMKPAWTSSTTRAMMRWSTSTNCKGHKQHQKKQHEHHPQGITQVSQHRRAFMTERWTIDTPRLECFLEGVYPILISLTDNSFQYCPLLMGNDVNDQNVGASLHTLNPFCFRNRCLCASGYLVFMHACFVCKSPRASTAWAARAMML